MDRSSLSPRSLAQSSAERLEQGQVAGLARVFSALQHRNYRLFWLGQLVSLIGTWMQTVAQTWLVLQLTDSALLLGLVGALQFLPVLLLSLFGGVLADRFPKRNVILVTQTAAMILAFALAILTSTGTVKVWHVMVLAALLGVVNAIDMPTRQSFIVEMVGKRDLPNAIALNSSIFNAARIIGPAIAGLLIGPFGVATCFYINGLSFIAVIASLLAIQVDAPRMRATVQSSVWRNLLEGLSYIRRTRFVWLLMIEVGLLSTFGMNFNVVIPVYARQVLRVDAAGYGFLMTAIGIGAVIGALFLAYLGRQADARFLIAAGIAFGVLQVIVSGVSWYPLSAVLLGAIGYSFIAVFATANSLLQTVAPDHLRGRVMSVHTLMFAGSTPLGNLLAGAAAQAISPVAPLLIGGLVCAGVALAGWRALQAGAQGSLSLR